MRKIVYIVMMEVYGESPMEAVRFQSYDDAVSYIEDNTGHSDLWIEKVWVSK